MDSEEAISDLGDGSLGGRNGAESRFQGVRNRVGEEKKAVEILGSLPQSSEVKDRRESRQDRSGELVHAMKLRYSQRGCP